MGSVTDVCVSSASDLQYIFQVFEEIDRDASGKMSLREMKNYMSHRAPNLLPTATSLFNRADRLDQGRVSFDQLMHVLFPSARIKEIRAMLNVACPCERQKKTRIDGALMEDVAEMFRQNDCD